MDLIDALDRLTKFARRHVTEWYSKAAERLRAVDVITDLCDWLQATGLHPFRLTVDQALQYCGARGLAQPDLTILRRLYSILVAANYADTNVWKQIRGSRPRRAKVKLTGREVRAAIRHATGEDRIRGYRDAILLSAAAVRGGTAEDLLRLRPDHCIPLTDGGVAIQVADAGELRRLPCSDIAIDWHGFVYELHDAGAPSLFLRTTRDGREWEEMEQVITESAVNRAIAKHMRACARGGGIADLHHWWRSGGADDDAPRW